MNVQINSSVQRAQKLKGKEMWTIFVRNMSGNKKKYDQISIQKLVMKAMLS